MFLRLRITVRLKAFSRGGTSCACLQTRVLEESLTTTQAMRLATMVTAIDVQVHGASSLAVCLSMILGNALGRS